MKLTNPTDDTLSSVFAEKVAGWSINPANGCCYHSEKEWRLSPLCGGWPKPAFTRSADAVLPWLEKHTWRGCSYRSPSGSHFNAQVEIVVNYDKQLSASDKSFAHAAVIALLRAHGVEVEFTK